MLPLVAAPGPIMIGLLVAAPAPRCIVYPVVASAGLFYEVVGVHVAVAVFVVDKVEADGADDQFAVGKGHGVVRGKPIFEVLLVFLVGCFDSGQVVGEIGSEHDILIGSEDAVVGDMVALSTESYVIHF